MGGPGMAVLKRIPWALLCLAPTVVGCKEVAVQPEELVRPVKIHEIGSLDPAAYRDYPGTVSANQEARMGFEVAGRVTEFLVKEGDEVTADQVLARLDPSDYNARLRAAQADLNKAQSSLDRSLGIRERNPSAIAEEQIEEHRRGVEVAQAQLAIAQKAVDDTQLKAPFAGRMARKLVADFANVQAKEPVLILQDIATLEIKVNVPERDMARKPRPELTRDELIEQLQPLVIVSAIPDQTFPARIKEFATTADPVTRTFVVTFTFDPATEYSVLPGMTARVKIVVDPELAWSIPASAVQETASNGVTVWKVDPTTMQVRRAPVELTEGMQGDRVRLSSGVDQGDLVAISGVTQLREGMQVTKFSPSDP